MSTEVSMKTHARIIGTGSFLPDNIVTNKDLEEKIDTTDEWIFSRSGIRQRHVAVEGQTTSDLGTHAAKNAIEAAGIELNDIDLIICATTTPDLVFPSTACLIQAKLGIDDCIAFDIQAVCAGFVYALDVADRYIRSGGAKHALVIGAETFSRILDWTDRSTCVLFGDGAGAVVLKADETPGILSCHLHAQGKYADLLCVPVGVSTNFDALKSAKAFTVMAGSDVFKHAVHRLGESVDEVLKANNLSRDEVDWLVPHQANIRIIKSMADRLKLSMEKVIVTIDSQGNTSAASIPLALDVAVRDGRIKKDHKIILEAFGGGFTWGSALVQM